MNTNFSIFSEEYCLVLIHGNIKTHLPSLQAVERWNKLTEGMTIGIRKIEVANASVKQWLLHNTRNIVISEIPCIIFCRQHHETLIYNVNNMEKILTRLNVALK